MTNSRHGPLFCAEIVYVLLFLAEISLCVSATGRHLIYPLDDTYITMAMAKHFALHGVWGVTPYAFTSATSTPLYVLLIAAAYRLTAVTEWWPLLLAFISGGSAIVIADRILSACSQSKLTALLAVVVLTPMATIAHLGMEHTLHITLTLLFAWRAAPAINNQREFDWLLVVLTPLLVMTRFEGLFLVASCALLLLIRRSFLLAASILAAAALPVTHYGLLALAHGWFFLPNSVMLKGAGMGTTWVSSLLTIVFRPFIVLHLAPHLIGILGALLFTLWATRTCPPWSRSRILLWLSLLTLIAHVTLADVGWIFRYEAYLIALSVVSLAAALPLRKAAFCVTTVAMAILLVRSVRAFMAMPSIAEGIYSQQYQMARFVERYYPSASVAANDIGAIDYKADLHLFDLAGLADPEVLRLKRCKQYTTAAIQAEAITRGTQIAIVYDDWFSNRKPAVFGGPSLPRSWIRVARWRTPNGKHLGSDTVSFYAVRPDQAGPLLENLNHFATDLPANVTRLNH